MGSEFWLLEFLHDFLRQQCCRINRDDFLSGQPEIQEYEWGELQIKREPYAYGLYQVTLRAKIREGEREIVFTYLREE